MILSHPLSGRPTPELNPVDYTMWTVWSVLQERVCRTKISYVDELKRHIISEWAALSHTVIDSDISNFPR